MASSVTQNEFQDALNRYPSLIKRISRQPKNGGLTLEELDEFRYHTALNNFSKSTGHIMKLFDLKMLIEWKMRHGKFRPTLAKLVGSNSNEELATATKNAFDYYADNKDDLAGTLEKLIKPLRGIGPAAGSLLLAIHDSQNIVYFSDELYRWLCADGDDVSLCYTIKEFEELCHKAKVFMKRIKCTPVELEKAAYVFIRENDPEPKESQRLPRGRPPLPESEKTPKKQSNGRPRGRPALPESEKKPKKLPSGRPRGRPALPESEKKPKKLPSGRPRGRPALSESEKSSTKQPSGRPRGRPPGVVTRLVVEEAPDTQLSKETVNNQDIALNTSTVQTNDETQEMPVERKRKSPDSNEGANKYAKRLLQMSFNS